MNHLSKIFQMPSYSKKTDYFCSAVSDLGVSNFSIFTVQTCVYNLTLKVVAEIKRLLNDVHVALTTFLNPYFLFCSVTICFNLEWNFKSIWLKLITLFKTLKIGAYPKWDKKNGN